MCLEAFAGKSLHERYLVYMLAMGTKSARVVQSLRSFSSRWHRAARHELVVVVFMYLKTKTGTAC